ncbi:GIY-YIG nuclease family protein [Sediminibacterium soli]|uniref:GIY-YIG nuclease family protein n=1 Tax=Sediminibacterium soli TaxID=2698829 RepID=UPI001379B1B2|nr:GIY-YIG nuclease family protein [Sediminibacterium soli]
MYKTYILYSASCDRFYIGYTGDDLLERIRRHNSHHKGFTGAAVDWALRYYEVFPDKASAMRREREIKLWKSRVKIIQLINSAGLEHSD